MLKHRYFRASSPSASELEVGLVFGSGLDLDLASSLLCLTRPIVLNPAEVESSDSGRAASTISSTRSLGNLNATTGHRKSKKVSVCARWRRARVRLQKLKLR